MVYRRSGCNVTVGAELNASCMHACKGTGTLSCGLWPLDLRTEGLKIGKVFLFFVKTLHSISLKFTYMNDSRESHYMCEFHEMTLVLKKKLASLLYGPHTNNMWKNLPMYVQCIMNANYTFWMLFINVWTQNVAKKKFENRLQNCQILNFLIR